MAKREGHPAVSVYMMAYDAPRIIDFACNVFGGEVLLRDDRPDGTVRHASVRIDDSVVMIADGMEEYPSFPVWLHVYVDDVDAIHNRALEHGATSVQEPKDNPDGDRRSGVKDVSGNVWWIGSATGPER